MLWLFKFLVGWVIWIITFLLSIISSLIFWNWDETFTIDMKIVISEIAGESVWNAMTFNLEGYDGDGY